LGDQDDIENYQKICDILLEAGYYRARISTISPFDKILGGLCWTITGLLMSVDIELKDESSLGEMVHLAEKVTECLTAMRAPFILYPHQIQGLNYEHILPAVEWLCKELAKSRD
jgi:hypothetical protein